MASNRALGKTGRPKLFSPVVTREEAKYVPSLPSSLTQRYLIQILKAHHLLDMKSLALAIKSTQEIPLDWSRFENHTFFNSAQSKVNVAFDRIINEYPFDGSQKEVEAFEDSLTGYENYILEIFPKSNGFLLISGTSTTENPLGGIRMQGLGTYIKVFDSAGSQFPQFSRKNDGAASYRF